MARLTIEITLDNDAFQPKSGIEIARILRRLAAEIEYDNPSYDMPDLHDRNGQNVGRVSLEEDY